MSAQHPMTYAAFVARATADPDVVGLVLKGSHAHDGMATRHSDHDLYVVLADSAHTGLAGPAGPAGLAGLDGFRSAELDLVVVTVAEFRRLGGFERYALARSRVVLDRLDGGIAEMVAAKGWLDAAEASRVAAARLDAYANSLYRSVKNARDGHPLAARLDAGDSAGFLLELLFALDRRPRPYNKYLAWELERFPLPGWDTRELLSTVARVAETGDADVQRELFGRVETAVRAAGHAAVLDAWGEDLRLMRPRASDDSD
ncbi:hypothetical protein ACFWR9_37635 [Streptomyces sp. NPDC058534]|uniref:hypothetical protein n=1 Tax=Streptomyces sp. NPDC058534 TaxID=3346541 RepID=UPI00364E5995